MARTITSDSKNGDLSEDKFITRWWTDFLNIINTKGINASTIFYNTRNNEWNSGVISKYNMVGYPTEEELNNAIPYATNGWSTGGGDYGYMHHQFGGITDIPNGVEVDLYKQNGEWFGKLPLKDSNGNIRTISTGINILGNMISFIRYNNERRPVRYHHWRPLFYAKFETKDKLRVCCNAPNVKFRIVFSSGASVIAKADNDGWIDMVNHNDISDKNRWVRGEIWLRNKSWAWTFNHSVEYMDDASKMDTGYWLFNTLMGPNSDTICRVVEQERQNGKRRFAVLDGHGHRNVTCRDEVSGNTVTIGASRKSWHQEIPKYIIEVPETQTRIKLRNNSSKSSLAFFI